MIWVQWRPLGSKILQKDLRVSGHSWWVIDTDPRRMAPSENILKKRWVGAVFLNHTIWDYRNAKRWVSLKRSDPEPSESPWFEWRSWSPTIFTSAAPLSSWLVLKHPSTLPPQDLCPSSRSLCWGNLAADISRISAHIPLPWGVPWVPISNSSLHSSPYSSFSFFIKLTTTWHCMVCLFTCFLMPTPTTRI